MWHEPGVPRLLQCSFHVLTVSFLWSGCTRAFPGVCLDRVYGRFAANFSAAGIGLAGLTSVNKGTSVDERRPQMAGSRQNMSEPFGRDTLHCAS
ncbi:hypothetical protein PSAC2689_90303 [Paraburkholderia sacchari]